MSKSLDKAYLQSAVGDVLAKGIAQTVGEKPADPIEFLAQYLLKSVADEKAEKALDARKKMATEAAASASAASAAEKEAADQRAEAQALQLEKEDKRLASLLENATSSSEVFSAVLSFARARTGASGYVMMTDLAEKVMPKKAPPPAEGEEAAPAEGEEGEAPPPEEPAEPEEPPPKFAPTVLEYVAATSSDEALLLGKTLPRPPAAEEDGPPVATGVGEGVTFGAIDAYLAGGSKSLHIPNAVQDRSVKFWYLPRVGAYACAPFEDFEGDVLGVLGFDTLGLERAFTADELSLLEGLAAQTAEHVQRIEAGLAELHHEKVAALGEKYPKSEEGAYPTFAGDEGCEPLDAAKGALALTADVLKTLAADDLKFLETRRTVTPGVLATLKGVCALVSPEMAEALPTLTWGALKGGIATGDLKWGDELFAAIGAFDVMGGSGEGGWGAAEAMVEELTAAPEEGEPLIGGVADASLLAKVLCDWLVAAVALHKLKLEAEAPPPEPEAEE